jgi:hypothetical protein
MPGSYVLAIRLLWDVFVLYWLALAFGNNRTVYRSNPPGVSESSL